MRRKKLVLLLVAIFTAISFILVCQGCGKEKNTYITFGKPFIVNVGSQEAFLSAEIVVKVPGKLKNKEEKKIDLQAALVNALVKALKEEDPKSVTPEDLIKKLKGDKGITDIIGKDFEIQFTRFVVQ